VTASTIVQRAGVCSWGTGLASVKVAQKSRSHFRASLERRWITKRAGACTGGFTAIPLLYLVSGLPVRSLVRPSPGFGIRAKGWKD
jgi:hypothetical protein